MSMRSARAQGGGVRFGAAERLSSGTLPSARRKASMAPIDAGILHPRAVRETCLRGPMLPSSRSAAVCGSASPMVARAAGSGVSVGTVPGVMRSAVVGCVNMAWAGRLRCGGIARHRRRRRASPRPDASAAAVTGSAPPSAFAPATTGMSRPAAAACSTCAVPPSRSRSSVPHGPEAPCDSCRQVRRERRRSQRRRASPRTFKWAAWPATRAASTARPVPPCPGGPARAV